LKNRRRKSSPRKKPKPFPQNLSRKKNLSLLKDPAFLLKKKVFSVKRMLRLRFLL
jgi:hypothetical protein